MILLSLHPSPASETSAFNKIRAFSSRCAGLFPFRIKASNCSRAPELSRTTYLFTAFSRVAIVPSVARTTTQANHQILSNWLKRATSPASRDPEGPEQPHRDGEMRRLADVVRIQGQLQGQLPLYSGTSHTLIGKKMGGLTYR